MSETSPVLVLDPDPKVLWPVDVRLPADGGEFVTHRFEARIRVLAESAYAAMLDAAAAPGAPEKSDTELLAENAALFPRLIVGWQGVQAPDRTAVPFSETALVGLVTGPHGKAISAGLWHAIAEIRHGVRLGNSVAPPVAG